MYYHNINASQLAWKQNTLWRSASRRNQTTSDGKALYKFRQILIVTNPECFHPMQFCSIAFAIRLLSNVICSTRTHEYPVFWSSRNRKFAEIRKEYMPIYTCTRELDFIMAVGFARDKTTIDGNDQS